MSYNLGALVTSMVVQGRQAFERDVDAAGRALERAGKKGDDLERSLSRATVSQDRMRAGLGDTTRETLRMSDAAQAAATRKVADWLAVLTYAVLALVAVLAVGVLALFRIAQVLAERRD